MKIKKIFLASSVVEFQKERQELMAFMNRLNRVCVKKGVYLELEICEGLSNAVAADRKQNEYNEHIRNSEYFFLLLGRGAGEYTIEEFEAALDQWKRKGAPKIYVYFKELSGAEKKKSISDFEKRIEGEVGIISLRFTHIEELKVDLLKILSQDAEVNAVLRWEGRQFFLDDYLVLSCKKQRN